MKKFSNYIPLLILIILIIAISAAIYKSSKNQASNDNFNTDLVKQKLKLPDFSLPDLFDDNKNLT